MIIFPRLFSNGHSADVIAHLHYVHYIIVLLFSVDVFALEQIDTTTINLNEITVTGSGKQVFKIADGGKIRFNPDELAMRVHTLGEADIVNALKNFAGVSTAGDYGAGLRVDGAEPSQTLFRIDRVPIFYPYRFGGIFSTFNTSHFGSATFSRNIHNASFQDRLGSEVDFNSKRNIDRPGGTINVGLLSSSMTVETPIVGGLSIIASGRISYIDQLYGKLLSRKATDIKYKFADLNFRSNYDLPNYNNLYISLFYSNDRLYYGDTNYSLDTNIGWRNFMTTAGWEKTGNTFINQRAYWSSFSNTLGLWLPQFDIRVPSFINVLGIAGDFRFPAMLDENLTISSGYILESYRNRIQQAEVSRYGNQDNNKADRDFTPLNARVYCDLKLGTADKFNIAAGVSLNYFHNSDGYNTLRCDPKITFTQPIGKGNLSLHLGSYSQFLHQIGFSETGMSTDFWISACKTAPVQRAYSAALNYFYSIPSQSLSISTEIYWKRVLSQPEYAGQIFDLLLQDYSPLRYIMEGDGHNAGLNVTIRKDSRPLSGGVSAGYGIAPRKYADNDQWHRGRTDAGINLNADVEWEVSSHWLISGSFQLSSGRPYTPTKAMYLIAENLITEYGEPNSRRLPAYHRLDLSATWHFESYFKSRHRLRHLVNVSIINAYGHRNVEFSKYVVDTKSGVLALKNVYSLYRFLPSVSYTLQF